jgi:hypothetical protein
MNISKNIKEAFKNNFFLKIKIENHVSGFRVSLSDIELGEITNITGSSLEDTILECLGSLDEISNKKKNQKMMLLENKRKTIQKELELVNKELSSFKLDLFRDKI